MHHIQFSSNKTTKNRKKNNSNTINIKNDNNGGEGWLRGAWRPTSPLKLNLYILNLLRILRYDGKAKYHNVTCQEIFRFCQGNFRELSGNFISSG